MFMRHGLIASSLMLSLTACGVFGEKFGTGNDSSAVSGSEEVTDDWSCESNNSGEWDCYQGSPDENSRGASVVDSAQDKPGASAQNKDPNMGSTDAVLPLEEAAAATGVSVDSSTADQAAYVQENYDWQQLSSDAYVLQLASHTTLENAQRALTALDAPGADVVKTWSENGDRFVIIAGSYPNMTAAEAAANAYLTRNVDASYWIRSTANFLKALQ
jgi:septal ring-binding cell division protein DamX